MAGGDTGTAAGASGHGRSRRPAAATACYPTGAGGGAGSHGSQSYLTGDADYRGKVIVKGGCGCDVAPTSSGPGAILLLGAMLTFKRRRRR